MAIEVIRRAEQHFKQDKLQLIYVPLFEITVAKRLKIKYKGYKIEQQGP